jgi:hypothetical protein
MTRPTPACAHKNPRSPHEDAERFNDGAAGACRGGVEAVAACCMLHALHDARCLHAVLPPQSEEV